MKILNIRCVIATIIIFTTYPTHSDQVDENFVTLIGSIQNFGYHKFTPGETIGSFISRQGGVPASEKMFAAFQNGKTVPGVAIKLHRAKSVISINVEPGSSFYNTLLLRTGDVVEVRFDEKVFWFGFPKFITNSK